MTPWYYKHDRCSRSDSLYITVMKSEYIISLFMSRVEFQQTVASYKMIRYSTEKVDIIIAIPLMTTYSVTI